ncbi:unnamed protein product [Phytophthora lilii]|uniref:Unnamed protein product n=1 Tax=Phytophthora lilii TaxID=2077276 RepID=A0A9W6U1A3_9STRA|nr:unnamed protein product [Phytophthora lilii]
MTHGEDNSSTGSSDKVATTDYVYARRLVQAYFAMLTEGCQKKECTNTFCCSNPQTPAFTPTEAVIKSIYFATQAPVPLCIDIYQEPHEMLFSTAVPELPLPHKQQEEPVLVPEQVEKNQKEEPLPQIEEPYHSKEELHPETSEAEVPKPQQPECIITEPSATRPSPVRKSTPRRRLSVAVQLDNGLNKNRKSPVKRPTIITRVVVQPKHKSVSDPATGLQDDVTNIAVVTNVTPAEVVAVPEPQQEQASSKVASPTKDIRQRRLSRPKEKLFDAIKRSFSRTKKAPLGSA